MSAEQKKAVSESDDRLLGRAATTQSNLGNALQILGEREEGTERLEAAVAAYNAALEVFTRGDQPFRWAATQSNLGNALHGSFAGGGEILR